MLEVTAIAPHAGFTNALASCIWPMENIGRKSEGPEKSSGIFIISFPYLTQYNSSNYCIRLELQLLFGSIFCGTTFQLGSYNYYPSFATPRLVVLNAPCCWISLPPSSLLIPEHTYVNICYIKLSLLIKFSTSNLQVCILFYANISTSTLALPTFINELLD